MSKASNAAKQKRQYMAGRRHRRKAAAAIPRFERMLERLYPLGMDELFYGFHVWTVRSRALHPFHRRRRLKKLIQLGRELRACRGRIDETTRLLEKPIFKSPFLMIKKDEQSGKSAWWELDPPQSKEA